MFAGRACLFLRFCILASSFDVRSVKRGLTLSLPRPNSNSNSHSHLPLPPSETHQSPDIVEFHYLDVTIPQVRRRVRQEFEKNRYVADIRVVDTLLTKGRMELDETLNKWKNKTHVMRYFTDDPKVVPKQGFLDAFYEGKV